MRYLIPFITFCLIASASVGQTGYPKKLIQFGWDYPKVSFLKMNLAQMEKQPFDGVAFSFDFKIFDLFDTTVYPIEVFQIDDLKAIKWKKFTDNFIRVRAQSQNGPMWLNDGAWANIEKNLKNVSLAVKCSSAKGIFFDAEYYYGELPDKNPWVYTQQLYPGKTFDEVGQYVRKRGKQFMNAITFYKDDMELFCLWLLSLVYLQQQSKPLPETGMALYPFFAEGMLDAQKQEAKIIDGNELGYYYKFAKDFIRSGDEIRDWGAGFMPDELKSDYKNISIAQPVFYDALMVSHPSYDRGYSHAQQINWLRENLYNAYKTTDKYVWFYNQRINWWDNSVSPEIVKAVTDVRTKVAREFRQKNIFQGSSFEYDFNSNSRLQYGMFSFRYNPKSGQLLVSFKGENIKSFQIYKNSSLLQTVENPIGNIRFNIRRNPNSNLILIAQTNDNKSSIAFVN